MQTVPFIKVHPQPLNLTTKMHHHHKTKSWVQLFTILDKTIAQDITTIYISSNNS
jgi:hypothetical protein